MESLGMVLIAMLAYSSAHHSEGISQILPTLAALALGAQRLLPTLQQIYSAWANIAGSRESLAEALLLLNQTMPAYLEDSLPVQFRHAVQFDNVRFRYSSDGPWILDGFSLTLPKGARIGFVGRTGSGKTTTLDILMGLLSPTEGAFLVDGHPIRGRNLVGWQRNVAHVPQNIYLADATFAENIAFGVTTENIDLERVKRAARQAHIADFIEARPDGYEGTVGERGIRLSGGQRQRIGIARALYKQATLLVFDEATSALDNETEHLVMESIQNLEAGLTILLIAHRLTTLKNCDIIIELDHGRVVGQGSYETLLARSDSFRTMVDAIHSNLGQ
jgi:ATP-binding cassette subfamily B protein